jgi:mycothiol synthase
MQDPQSLAHGPGGWTIHVPASAVTEADVDAVLLGSIEAVRAKGGGTLRVWVHGDGPAAHQVLVGPSAVELGFRLERTLQQLRRPLPVDELMVPTLATRPFVPGQDEDAFLAVNNRAFEGHPEQGAWTAQELQAHYEEPWFDPEGFLLHEHDAQVVGFCWTKVHAHADPPMGEIYVIAVDPAAHQRGLGKQLVVKGLDHLSEQGLRQGMLFVDAANDAATRLYARLGFGLHHEDQAYALEVSE